ncbi:response regulator transcription factor [Paenibacillus thiaminolyticus]|uniref:DNA-binding response regulator n=1 Tax=Paenibacillus thiaminolyticus TaxID=49283 RepID=A0A3A3GIM2_PANTH|nr:response regulator transcription factor [Paenibacillus thiaminolyticus]RJG23265.1 DNA-binding response regulator [Paenibacillus thiaminolyticus]
MSNKVLLIDDEKNLTDMLSLFLEENGYQVTSFYHSQEAMQMLKQYEPDIIVSDLMLPEMDGNELVRAFHAHTSAPVLMISANTLLDERIRALENGADDFLCKPFSLKELDARIKALLRRSHDARESPTTSHFPAKKGDLTVNEYRRSLFVEGEEIEVTNIEFEIMRQLDSSPGKVFTRNELLDRIKGSERAYLDRTIDVHISNLRKKIEPDPKNPRYILTVWGAGYKYVL